MALSSPCGLGSAQLHRDPDALRRRPLLLGGDEFARTQRGNNNAYCHDDELIWFDWSAVAANDDLVEFTARLCRLREQHPVFRRRQFFTGTPAHDTGRDDLDWYRPDGQP